MGGHQGHSELGECEMATVADLDEQMKKLADQKAELIAKEREGVLESVRKQITLYGIKATELRGALVIKRRKRRVVKAANKTATKTEPKAAAKKAAKKAAKAKD